MAPAQICPLTRKSAPLQSACMLKSSANPVIRLQGGRQVRKDAPQQICQMLSRAGSGARTSQPASRNPDPELANAELLITFDLPLPEKLSLEESLGLITKQGYQRLLVQASREPRV